MFAGAAGEQYFGGFVAIAAGPHIADRVAGISALQDLLKLILTQWLAETQVARGASLDPELLPQMIRLIEANALDLPGRTADVR